MSNKNNRALESHYYQLLDLSPGVNLQECEKKYRKKLLELHPDRFPLGDPQRQRAEEKLSELNTAIERIRYWNSQQGASLSFRQQVQKAQTEKLNSLPVRVKVINK